MPPKRGGRLGASAPQVGWSTTKAKDELPPEAFLLKNQLGFSCLTFNKQKYSAKLPSTNKEKAFFSF
jgi:hypothetical protein